jgi:uncharacterized protein YjlB
MEEGGASGRLRGVDTWGMSHRRQTVEGVIACVFDDDGSIPNSELPVLIYKRALDEASAPACRELFASNGWTNSWVNGVYAFHHYHSTAHEVLGVVAGSARITLGGEKGETFRVEVGDAIVIPAGVGHCNEGSSGGFAVVGAYAHGRSWDLRTGKTDERPEALQNIKNMPLPETDPVHGEEGPLPAHWLGSN